SAREGITNVFKACRAQRRCQRHYPHLLRTLNRVVRRLEKHPLVRRVTPPQGGEKGKGGLDGGTIVNMLVANTPRFPNVPAALTDLAHGHPKEFLTARAAGSAVSENPEQAQGMTQSFICREWEPYGSPSATRRAGKRQFPKFPNTVL